MSGALTKVLKRWIIPALGKTGFPEIPFVYIIIDITQHEHHVWELGYGVMGFPLSCMYNEGYCYSL
jgi:disulfide oxidoreductase YuzD